LPQTSTFRWMGSKRRLAPLILSRFPEHTTYVEVFAGSGAVLFARAEPAKVEVLNDIDGDITNFFRVCKHHLVELCGQFRWAITSRKIFEWTKDTPPEVLTDIQRAARFYYLQRLCFGGKSTGRNFGVGVTTSNSLDLVNVEQGFSDIHARLGGVVIESLPWEQCLDRYDRPTTLFFMDPPYLGTAGYLGERWKLPHYEAIAAALRAARGKALLTINDHPDIRRVFEGFAFDRLTTIYTVGGSKKDAPRAHELLFRNFER
jgi:DNA adenine methylase